MAERWQTSESRSAAVFFRDSTTGAPVTGLTPTGTARYKDGTAGAPAVTVTEVSGGFYRVALASVLTKDALVVVDGGGSLTTTRYVALEVPVGGYVDQLDAAVSTRATAAAQATMQAAITALGTPAQASDTTTLLARLTAARALLLDGLNNLDVAVSTRATHAEATADPSGVTTLLARLTATRAGLLDLLSNLDAAVSTRARPVDVAVTVTAPTSARGEIGP